ncbi:class I SAM-dependent methyltransferase [Streptomyces sp. NPDC050610]|uniref:class I SAM-dependent methyltransferase n=1 Tax=Streptomyces sp. NPDC050610 TaxID=3157097 RepID=UPI00343CA008
MSKPFGRIAPERTTPLEWAAALDAHPRIRAVEMEYGPEGNLSRIHVVPHEDTSGLGTIVEDFAVDSWRAVFEDCYDPAGSDDELEDARYRGWRDGITGLPVPAADMAEWADVTVERIARRAPRRILEIGAGFGLLMEPLVRRLRPASYTATDFSQHAVARLRELAGPLTAQSPDTEITVAEGDALARPPGDGYDMVVINSVVQYFPSVLYLEAVLRRVLPLVQPGGHVYLGDLRHPRLLGAMTALGHRRAAPGAARETLAARVARDLRLDGELAVDPGHLHQLPRCFPKVTEVESAPRRGAAPTEMTLYRYDAVLHVGCAKPDGGPEWADGGELTLERAVAAFASPSAVAFRGIPNARLTDGLRAWRDWGTSQADAGGAEAHGAGTCGTALDPELLCTLAEQAGRRPGLRWTPEGDDGRFDLWCPEEDGTRQPSCTEAPAPGDDAPPARQPVYPPGTEARRREEIRSAVAALLAPGDEPPEVVFVSWLPGAR